jgi:protein SCO1/2
MRRSPIIAICVLAMAIAVSAAIALLWIATTPVQREAAVGNAQGTDIGGPFTLVSETGGPVTEAVLAGKPTLMYFGYTFCPEICPTTLTDMSNWITQLGPDADKLNYVFVTVDPERDTPKVMQQYVASFDKRIRGFTGTPEQIAKIAKEYRIYYKKIPSKDGSYVMDHSAIIYMMSRTGKFQGIIAYQEDDKSVMEKLRALISGEVAAK